VVDPAAHGVKQFLLRVVELLIRPRARHAILIDPFQLLSVSEGVSAVDLPVEVGETAMMICVGGGGDGASSFEALIAWEERGLGSECGGCDHGFAEIVRILFAAAWGRGYLAGLGYRNRLACGKR
jgi:hypothetical protein